MRKYPVPVGLLAVALLATACTDAPSGAEPDQMSVTIKANQTGTYSLGDLSVTAPAGVVAKDTSLSVTSPVQVPVSSAPLRSTSVKFDLSLAGNAEPSKPLDVAIPLKGSYLPVGVSPAQALLYTQLPSGRWSLVPATVDTGNVLHAQLTHLSPKVLTYVSAPTLTMLAGILPDDNAVAKSDCATSVQTPDGKVQFTGANKGWSNKPGSPVVACLGKSGSNATLSISNKLSYIMQVAATDGLSLNDATGSTSEALAVLLAKRIFPDKKVKAYLGRDSELGTPLPSSSLPATVQLRAEPDTFLAEAAWSSLKFLVGLITGVQGDGLTNLVKTVVDNSDVVDCLRTTLSISQGNVPSVGDVLDLVSSECTEVIVGAVGAYAANQSLWDQFWHRIFVVGEGVATGWDTFVTAAYGIQMQFVGTVSVVVDIERPLSTVIRPFVGTWNAHGLQMTIGPNATGRAEWNAGPCNTYSGSATMCSGRADVVFVASGRRVKGTYTNTSYTTWEGKSAPGNCTSCSDNWSGRSFTLELAAPYILLDVDAVFGGRRSYLCDLRKASKIAFNGACNQ